jgi:hypothetical protein
MDPHFAALVDGDVAGGTFGLGLGAVMRGVPPGSLATLFNPDVVTAPEVAGQELLAGTWTGRRARHPRLRHCRKCG